MDDLLHPRNDTDILKEYSVACTTRIVGLAAEECGRSSYDIDQIFCREELMDPDFPMTMVDDFDLGFVTPEDILVDICGKRVEVIVEAIGNMENCWTRMESCVKDDVATKLWEFVKDEAEYHVESMYGEEYKKEFARLGNKFFGNKSD